MLRRGKLIIITMGESTAAEAVKDMQSMSQGAATKTGPQGAALAAHTEGRGQRATRRRTSGPTAPVPYVLNRCSRIPVAQAHEYEYRIPPGPPCICHGYVYIQGECIQKTG